MSDLTGIDLLGVKGITEAKVRHLLNRFKSAPAIFTATYAELAGECKTEPELARRLCGYERDSKTQEAIDHAAALGVTTITYLDEIYPENLRGIPQAPPIIFVRGELKASDARALAIIGTRRATAYGRAAADRFARDFAKAQITVVSGLARGIDTQVHESCLAAGGRTIAVMGTGMDRIYPPENRRLAERIVKNGVLITEFTFGTPPLAMNFPKRNRIISGLSLGIIAVEAKEASGVMNTVNWALNQSRDVFAVPGSIFSKYSLGTNALIKAGAAMAASAQDVLEELKLIGKQHRAAAVELALGEDETAIMSLLSESPVYLDEIAVRLSQPVPVILNTLLTMELKGVIRQLPGKAFVRGFG